MSIQLLQEVSDNYQLAKRIHEELSQVFDFIYMPGYSLLNIYQYLDESITQLKVKRCIAQTYHTYMPDKLPQTANIADPLIGGKNRKQLKMQDTWDIIQQSWKIHRDWEESSLQLYQKIAKELFASGEISAFNFVGEIIKDVKAELVYVTDKVIELESHSFDMPTIVGEQDTILERYEYLIRNLLGKSKHYHHWNSNYDPEARTSILDKYPD